MPKFRRGYHAQVFLVATFLGVQTHGFILGLGQQGAGRLGTSWPKFALDSEPLSFLSHPSLSKIGFPRCYLMYQNDMPFSNQQGRGVGVDLKLGTLAAH